MKRYKQTEIDELANILKQDGIISVPTDTVFGICCRINSKNAYNKLMTIKNRPSDMSFPVMVLNEKQIADIAILNDNIKKLIYAFMPGPITLVLNKKSTALTYINNGGLRETDEIAIRMAPTKALENLIYKAESPIFMTSANKSGQPTCTSVEEIEKSFPNLDGIMEGNITFGMASTIVDCTQEEIKIQRKGPISEEQIIKVLKKGQKIK